MNAINNQENILVNRNAVVLQQFASAGWLPTLAAPEYLVNGVAQYSGDITPGSLLTFANTGGLIYFTTDGSDPRQVGGGINPLAQVYTPGQSGPALVLNDSTQIWKPRALSGSTWSALSTADPQRLGSGGCRQSAPLPNCNTIRLPMPERPPLRTTMLELRVHRAAQHWQPVD